MSITDVILVISRVCLWFLWLLLMLLLLFMLLLLALTCLIDLGLGLLSLLSRPVLSVPPTAPGASLLSVKQKIGTVRYPVAMLVVIFTVPIAIVSSYIVSAITVVIVVVVVVFAVSER
uniref:Uncharacterized protein n=1 Tax=Anopheles merus TaxID=30066 RepID=A0A182VAB3_ANOME